MHRFGTSEEDDDDDMGMDVKEEDDGDDDDDDDEEKNMSVPAVVSADVGILPTSSGSNRYIHYQEYQNQLTPQGGGARRCRPHEEKERTKLRERQRRAITAKILAGLRRHGNYNLRVRADINDVISALTREAGWVVLPDGTTYPSRSQGTRPIAGASNTAVPLSSSQMPAHHTSTSLRCISPGYRNTADYSASHMKGVFVPASSPYNGSSGARSQTSAMIGDGGVLHNDPLLCDSMDSIDDRQVVDMPTSAKLLERDFSGTPYVPVYVMLLVVMSFHECGGNVGDDVCIPLPHWVSEIGQSNPDIFFTDRAGRRDPECLSWGVDNERVLRGRTAVEVYFDCMRSFRVEFDEFLEDGVISMIVVGLGPCGDLRYPCNHVKHGWRYPGIGEFQCYNQYMLKSLQKAAEIRGHSFWARGPENTGSYNSMPHETGFFCDGGDYDGYHGEFFLSWYSQALVDHGDRVLSLAKLVFEGTHIAARMSSIHLWYKTASHAAELTAGFYNSSNRDGYAAVMAMLKRHGAVLCFTCSGISMMDNHIDFSESLADLEGLSWQVLNAAWDACIPVASVNSFTCHDREGLNYLLEKAKPMGDPDGRHFSAFTYLRLARPTLDGQTKPY